MSTGHTHRLPSVEKGREPDLTAEGTSEQKVDHPGRDFFWGVATSGYQSEGGYNGPDEPLNNWAWAERNGDVVPSGRTSDFWTLSHEDFGRCRDMGLNAFRLSVEWSRVQPTTVLGPKAGLDPLAPAPPFDDRALYSYAQRLADCRAHGLEPIITLHHFVYPSWLGLDAWLKPETVDHFLAFVEKTVTYFLHTLPEDFGCAPPRWFITINEPNLQAFNHYLYRIFPSGHLGMEPTVQCLAHLMEAHVRAYRLIHELYARTKVKPMVSFNNYSSDLYWSDMAMIDLLFAPSRGVPRPNVRQELIERAKEFDDRFNAAKLFPMHGPRYFLGQWLKNLHHLFARRGFVSPAWSRLLDVLYQSDKVPLDYIAFDYYDPFIAHALRWPSWRDFDTRKRSFRDWVLESVASKWWDWRMLPEGLAFFVKHLGRYGLPLIIAENGMALRRLPDNSPSTRRRDNIVRSQYLREHVRVVSRLVERGQPLIGYLHWSLFDNYEWGSFAPRFGLFSLDYTVYPTRHAVDATGDNPSATYQQEIEQARQQFAAAARRAEKRSAENPDSSGATPAILTEESNILPPDSVQQL
jgi:beta-glucosidase/6-phospho-beta-glucosidase/beta-galactosidase